MSLRAIWHNTVDMLYTLHRNYGEVSFQIIAFQDHFSYWYCYWYSKSMCGKIQPYFILWQSSS